MQSIVDGAIRDFEELTTEPITDPAQPESNRVASWVLLAASGEKAAFEQL